LPETAIVIPNWNGARHLPECLESLARQTLKPGEVIVVDNGSSDDSIDLIRRCYPWVRLIQHPDNRGFPAAVNAGIRTSNADLVALLNNDTRVEPDWLEQLVTGLQQWPEASFAACKMLRFDPPHPIDSAGDRFSLLAGAGANLGAGLPRDAHSQLAWTFGACAGAALYRRALFEDVDFDLRAQVAGHRCLYVPDAVVYHKRGASTDNASREVQARIWRNAVWVAGKNLPPLLLAVWLVAFALRLSRRAALAGLAHAWRRLRPGDSVRQAADAAADRSRSASFQHDFVPALKQALSRLPAKRRETGPLRRRGSLALLPILLRPVRTIAGKPGTP
jgi:GT2 family glycosyltransferase